MWFSSRSKVLVCSTLFATPIAATFYEKKTVPSCELKMKIKKAQKLVESTMAVQGIPGLSIAVSINGKMIWKDGFGLSDVETSTKCTGDSVMRIASISKPITAALTAQLVENENLDLDADIRTYLPEFPAKKFNNEETIITLRQLLCHTGGIRHYANSEKKTSALEDPSNNNTKTEEFLSNKKYATTLDALDIFKNDDLVEKPGTKFFYTTYGLTLAGAILEKVSGKTFRKLSSTLFSDLGMKQTRLDTNETIVNQRVRYYRRNSRHVLENCPEVDCSYKYAGGGIISNVTDLLIFANAILYSSQSNSTNSLLRKETLKKFLTPHATVNENTSAGLGWFLVPGSDVKSLEGNKSANAYFYHTGAAVGASSVLLIRPDEKKVTENASGICVAILCNVQDTSVLPLSLSIADLFTGLN